MKWEFPYCSRRMPVFARRIVATGQPLAAQAGLEMMRKGGNAVDAAVATAAALTVVEPTANGLGSDAFAIVWDGAALHGLNASGRSASSATIDRLGDVPKVPSLGWPAVTVPGAISAWAGLSARFGRLPFATLIEPAIAYAASGYPVSPMCASGWARAVERYGAFEPWMRTFAPTGRGPAIGSMVVLPDHAATLRSIAGSKGESFYRGDIARAIAAASVEAGGWLSADDLASHAPLWVEPWSVEHSGAALHELPPNGQGVAALEALAILSRFDLSGLDRDCPDLLHLEIESMKAAFADAKARIADPALGLDRAREMISAEFIARRAGEIDPSRARDWGAMELKSGGTVYLCTADDDGMMVSYIQSNYEGFGSGVVIPGTGIAMQNRGACFSMAQGHPNRYGPSKRPYQTIIPGFLTRDGAPLAAFGVMGGFMQPQGHLQVAVRMLDQRLNPQAALEGPRFQVMDDGTIAVEPGFPAATLDELERRGHRIDRRDEASVVFGGGQVIWRQENGAWIGASDSRRDGQAVGC